MKLKSFKTKELSEFYKHPDMPKGVVNKCKECNKLDNKLNWHNKIDEKRDYDKNRHRYSINRLLLHKYYLIKRRCMKGNSNGQPYRVTGTVFISKEEWVKWCYSKENYKKFIEIYNNWVKSDFSRKLTPSIEF